MKILQITVGEKDESAEWEESYFPVNLDDAFTIYENLEIDENFLESIDYEDFSESSKSEF